MKLVGVACAFSIISVVVGAFPVDVNNVIVCSEMASHSCTTVHLYVYTCTLPTIRGFFDHVAMATD